MFLFTTGIVLSYKLNFFPENLKNKVKRLLKSEVKNHSCRENCQSVEVSLVTSKKHKAQLPKENIPTNFLSLYSTIKSNTYSNIQESEKHD